MRKVFDRIVQRLCECLDERTASGGAGFIELHTVNGLILDLDTFHILAADIKDTVHVRLKERRGIVVRHCLDFAFVQHEGRLDQRLAVTGGTGVYDLHTFRKLLINVFDGADGRSQRVAVIVVVEGVEECSVFPYQSGFCSRGTGVDPEECLAAVSSQILYRHLVLRVAGGKFFIFRIGGEQGIQTLYLDLHLYFALQSVLEFP